MSTFTFGIVGCQNVTITVNQTKEDRVECAMKAKSPTLMAAAVGREVPTEIQEAIFMKATLEEMVRRYAEQGATNVRYFPLKEGK